MRAGAVLPKQWHGASNTVSCALKGFLRGLLTGGVPTRPPKVDVYLYRDRYIAFEETVRLMVARSQHKNSSAFQGKNGVNLFVSSYRYAYVKKSNV